MPFPIFDDRNDYTPIIDMVVVVPSDTVDLQYLGKSIPCRGVIFNAAGNVKFDTAGGTTITLAISASWFGIQYIRVKRVWATGTTIAAGNIIACY